MFSLRRAATAATITAALSLGAAGVAHAAAPILNGTIDCKGAPNCYTLTSQWGGDLEGRPLTPWIVGGTRFDGCASQYGGLVDVLNNEVTGQPIGAFVDDSGISLQTEYQIMKCDVNAGAGMVVIGAEPTKKIPTADPTLGDMTHINGQPAGWILEDYPFLDSDYGDSDERGDPRKETGTSLCGTAGTSFDTLCNPSNPYQYTASNWGDSGHWNGYGLLSQANYAGGFQGQCAWDGSNCDTPSDTQLSDLWSNDSSAVENGPTAAFCVNGKEAYDHSVCELAGTA